MIAGLRRRFILVAMLSTLAVLSVMIGALHFISYRNMVSQADSILLLLAENDATFPEVFPWEKRKSLPEKPENRLQKEEEKVGGETGQPFAWGRPEMTPETPYETRYFSVTMDKSGRVMEVDTGKVAALVTEEAAAYARAVWQQGKKSGFYESYRFAVIEQQNGYLLLFIDRSRELFSYHTLVMASIFLSVAGLLAVLVLVVIFSKIVFKPVEVSYEKQKRFITDASHELKTPLTIISANVEVLEMEGQTNRWTESIHNQIARMTALIQQMVTLSKMEEKADRESYREFSLTQAVSETAASFVAPAKNAGKELEILVDGEYRYHGEEKQIRQMVSLLMDNAVKYCTNGGRIKLRLSRRGKNYQLIVWNTAEDMPKGALDIVFERFYRLDASRNSASGGSGIGLSIVKAIVEAHQGKITAKSEDGRSFQIIVLL